MRARFSLVHHARLLFITAMHRDYASSPETAIRKVNLVPDLCGLQDSLFLVRIHMKSTIVLLGILLQKQLQS